jgi:hypothetical protein
MPNPNAIVDLIQRLDPAPAAAKATRSPLVTVHFQAGATAQLDTARARAADMIDLLDDLRTQNAPVYIEIDPATQSVKQLLLPRVAVVAQTAAAPVGTRHEVTLEEAHARYYLDTANPDYRQMLADLQRSAQKRSTVLVTYALDRPEIIDVRSVPKTMAGARPPTPAGNPAAPAAAVSVTPAEAQQMFDLVSAQSCAPASPVATCIPFLFPRDGCWGRAHEMCRLIGNAGHAARKVWNFGALSVQTKNDPSCTVYWGWHVAPTLLVDTGSRSEVRVIDPSMFTAPVPQGTWVSGQNDAGSRVKDTDADVFWRNESGSSVTYDPTYANTNTVLTRYRNELRTRTIMHGPPPYPCP